MGLHQHEAAACSGVGLASIQRVEKGHMNISVETLCRYAYALGVAPVDVYPGLGIAPPHPIHTEPRPHWTRGGKRGKATIKLMADTHRNLTSEATNG
jgi:transcriptional regulator with XRE-family HTH domain